MGIVRIKYKKKNNQKVIYYCAEIYVKGVRVSRKIFSTKREAVLWHEMEKQKFTLSPTSLNDKMLFRDCLDKFFESAKTRILKNTFQRYELQSVHFYKSPLANVKMSELKGVKNFLKITKKIFLSFKTLIFQGFKTQK